MCSKRISHIVVAILVTAPTATAAFFQGCSLHVQSHHRSQYHLRMVTPEKLSQLRAAEAAGTIRAGVGPGRDLPALSRINTYPLPLQAATVFAISVSIGLFAALLAGPGFDVARSTFLWTGRPTWPFLGLVYFAAGVAHFTDAEGFENITPPNGNAQT